MQPQEVAGLQSLAEANGTSLTINPQTGLPEAFRLGNFFKSLLPTIAGIGVGLVPGMQGIGYGIAAGALTGAAVNKDDPLMGAVMGGLGGYGGSNLAASALNPAAATAATAATPGTVIDPTAAANITPYSSAAAPAGGVTPGLDPTSFGPNYGLKGGGFDPNAIGNTIDFNQTTEMLSPESLAQSSVSAGDTFGSNARQAMSNIGDDPMAFLKNNAMGVGLPLIGAAAAGMEPPETMSEEEFKAQRMAKFKKPLNLNYDTGLRLAAGGAIQNGGVMDLYEGMDTQPSFGGNQGYGLGRLNNLAQQQSISNAEQGKFARGGVPKLEDGGFVVPADVTFYLGNHNTEKGQQRLAQMYGGQPIRGPGTGLSDSIPTSIEGKEPARIANGESYIPRKAVMAHGGPEKFYKMMDKVRMKATGSTKQARSA
jgi:hypothetical protein